MSENAAHYLSQKENVKKHFALALRQVAQATPTFPQQQPRETLNKDRAQSK